MIRRERLHRHPLPEVRHEPPRARDRGCGYASAAVPRPAPVAHGWRRREAGEAWDRASDATPAVPPSIESAGAVVLRAPGDGGDFVPCGNSVAATDFRAAGC